MNKEILGLHHITALAGDPQRNVDFYAGILGLRLVKKTVNFDDPGTYHFYYGDGAGTPGTILTFFPWPGAPKGRPGTGQATVTSFSIPGEALGYWMDRLKSRHIAFEGPASRFDEEVLTFSDPDGLQLDLVASGKDSRSPWQEGPIPAEHAIRGFHSVTLSEESQERTASLLAGTLGFRLINESEYRFRYESGAGGPGTFVDVASAPGETSGRVAVGTVHHVAWRTPDDDHQRAWLQEIMRLGYRISPIMDRQYFRSIYFREPGGVLFEIATDSPGFTLDESPEQLGTHLRLPPWLEKNRPQIEMLLLPITVPVSTP